MRRFASSRQALRLAVSDGLAILVFVTIGLVSHHGGISVRGYARDALPFLIAWYGAALVFHAYERTGIWRIVATWAVGVPLGVLIRALVLGRSLNGKEAAFLGVSLVTIGVLVVALRAAIVLASLVSKR